MIYIEFTLTEALMIDPKALTIIDKDLQAYSLLIGKDKQGATKGVFLELIFTNTTKAIDAVSEVNGLSVNKNHCLR